MRHTKYICYRLLLLACLPYCDHTSIEDDLPAAHPVHPKTYSHEQQVSDTSAEPASVLIYKKALDKARRKINRHTIKVYLDQLDEQIERERAMLQ